jgi:hypothetical protein
MSRSFRAVPWVLTAITFAALCFMLLSAQGWRSELRWILVGSVAVLVAVAWLQAAALTRQGHVEAAAVLVWGVPVVTTYLLMFVGALAF